MKIHSIPDLYVTARDLGSLFKSMKTRATAGSVLIATFCIGVPSTSWGQNHVFLTSGGIDNQGVVLTTM